MIHLLAIRKLGKAKNDADFVTKSIQKAVQKSHLDILKDWQVHCIFNENAITGNILPKDPKLPEHVIQRQWLSSAAVAYIYIALCLVSGSSSRE